MITDFLIGPSILMYHSIMKNSNDPYSVSANAFREQISWLKDYDFEIISLSELIHSMKIRKYKSLCKKVVITFDDGYRDFLDNALSILLEHRATATVFLVTEMLGGVAAWNKCGENEPLMTEDEVRYIKKQGVSLGSHTATHVNLKLLDPDDQQRQLKDSQKTLSQLGETFYSFSYPWGQWTPEIAEAVKDSGYECALAVGEQTRMTAANAYCLPRITMTCDLELKHFQSVLTRTSIEMETRRLYSATRSMNFRKIKN